MGLSRELIRLEKIANLGLLAGQVGHEIGNTLTILKGKLDLYYLKKETDKENSNPEDLLRSFNDNIERLRQYTRFLQSNSIGDEHKVSLIDMAIFLKKTVSDLKSVGLLKYYEIIESYPEHIISFSGSIYLLDILFKNLLINSHHAMDGNGTLTISLCMQDAKHFDVSIADTGCGISHENLKKVFQKFYSTKSDNRATGLGLITSEQIVKHYNGTIEFNSEKGEGTKVTIRLPLKNHNDSCG